MRGWLCLAVAALAVTSPAFGAPGAVSAHELVAKTELDRKQQRHPPVENVRVGLQQLADCVVQTRREEAQTVVRTLYIENYTLHERFPHFFGPPCFDYERSVGGLDVSVFPFPMLPTLLADALIRVEFSTSGPDNFSAVPPLQLYDLSLVPTDEAINAMAGIQRERAQRERQNFEIWSVLLTIGECVARQVPDSVRALSLDQPNSESERQRIQSLQPAIQSCLTQGGSVRMRLADIRGALLLSYYRLAHANDAAPPSQPEANR